MELTDLLDLTFFGGLALFIFLDLVLPARRFSTQRGWRLRGAVSFVIYMAIALSAPFLWDEALAAHRLVDLSGSPLWLQGVAAFVAAELLIYAWHRALHQVPFLWRIHQTHHSAERVDIWGAFYFHPVGSLAWALVGSLGLVWAVGVLPEVAVVVGTVIGFLSYVQHANIRTPRWLGFLTARPEMHAAHHERGRHTDNFCDLPIIDRIFGTYRNPATWDEEAGFHDGASARVVDLMLLRDVTEPPDEGEPSRNSLEPVSA